MAAIKEKKTVLIPGEDPFVRRHIGPSDEDAASMLSVLGYGSIDALTDKAVPDQIRLKKPLRLEPGLSEARTLERLRAIAGKNRIFRSYLGMGYNDCVTPPVILRNVIENPGWYTAYTPYQSEIAQGRLEALLNFQTMIKDLTGLEVANASMLDEGTAAAEAMALSFAVRKDLKCRLFFVSQHCHPQTIDVVRTRAKPLGIEILLGDHEEFTGSPAVFGALIQYPRTDGSVCDYQGFCDKVHQAKGLVTAAADLMSLVLLKEPASFGADIAVGNSQRFGVPLGFGGPHAAYMATSAQYQRRLPGRIVGVSKDSEGRPALRLALQTREQHIRREKATSNICTAQVLLAVCASHYAVYHGPEGLKRIAGRINALTGALAEGLRRLGISVGSEPFFDTVRLDLGRDEAVKALAAARSRGINLRALDETTVIIALDETVTEDDVLDLLDVFGAVRATNDVAQLAAASAGVPDAFKRETAFLTHKVFNSHRSETEMMRYLHRLEEKDLALNFSMIPLGSCTMKLNAVSEMMAITWPEFGRLHPYAPSDQTQGYQELFTQLETFLGEIAGLPAVSLQPNAGSQGEYAGLLVIREYLAKKGQGNRTVCLIPQSAHGTNPASAAMAGMTIVPVASLPGGDIDLEDLKVKAKQHENDLAALMVTYPSTHGVFEEEIKEICETIHKHGGQVYMDGANLNAQVGLCRPGDIGADVCHINLHKTFCIPHGGGGPGMGPIAVAEHLARYLPGHPLVKTGGIEGVGAIAAAPWGSPSILPISWSFIVQMGADGLTLASKTAILNANYIAKRLDAHYPVLFKGAGGLVAHECILDLRPLKSAGILVEDVAKRLIDYGFHAPTVSWPVMGTMMVEPTESESKEELDRFCEAMISIRGEVREIEEGKADKTDNVLKNSPHTAEAVTADEWKHPYTREKAAYPAKWLRSSKFWPSVGRIDNTYGDRNFCCTLT